MIDALVGARVIITVQQPALQDLQLRPKVDMLEEGTISIVARVVETDELGIWIEHPDYPFPNPKTKRTEKQKAYILIRYEYITSIAYFPELPVSKDEVHRIGFVDTTE